MKKCLLVALLLVVAGPAWADENANLANRVATLFGADAKTLYNSYNDTNPNPLAEPVKLFVNVPDVTIHQIVDAVKPGIYEQFPTNSDDRWAEYRKSVEDAVYFLKDGNLNDEPINDVTKGLTDFLMIYYVKTDTHFGQQGRNLINQIRKEMKVKPFDESQWATVLSKNLDVAKH